jgi:localization factor PodJL
MELFPASVSVLTTGATARKPATPDRITTGSVEPPNPTPASTAPPLPPARPAGGEKLPATLGASALHVAASQGDPRAEFEFGVRYAEGRGVPQDLAAAAEWFERAAKQGLAPAQFRLGGQYEKGMGVKKDLDRARHLYLAASQSGNAKAMHNLAVLYAEGIDGKPDYTTAASWFRKAADHGMADSQFNLGVLYARGIGVEANLSEAYKWFALAARSGDRESAKKRDEIGARLDQATMTALIAAVEAWIAEAQPEAATQVKAPAGGWDSAQATAKRNGGPEPKTSRATP